MTDQPDIRARDMARPGAGLAYAALLALAALPSAALADEPAASGRDLGVTMSVIQDATPSSEAEVVQELQLPEPRAKRPQSPGRSRAGPPGPGAPGQFGREIAEQARENARQNGPERRPSIPSRPAAPSGGSGPPASPGPN